MDSTSIPTKKLNRFWVIVVFIFACSVCMYFLFAAPSDSTQTILHISKNETTVDIVKDLESKHVIRSVSLTRFLIRFLSSDGHIGRGDYLFEAHEGAFSVAWQLAHSNHRIKPVRVTLKEGATNQQMADMLGTLLPNFPKDVFLEKVSKQQGYLFPDTYFFFPLSTPDEIIEELSSNFKTKIASLQKDIDSSMYTKEDVVIMASIVQKEAHGKDDAPTIAGILWKRIELGMPLQVDAAPITYQEKGLPQTPIGNPGLIALDATVYPTSSPYLFYLHDKNGMVHWAKDFVQHKQNIANYLK
jgi:UPF0755 protein